MRIKLVTEIQIVASHSLSDYETPHPHLWKFKLIVTGDPILDGRIVDLPKLIDGVKALLKPYENTYLNERADLPAAARQAPTCETLGLAFFERIDREVLEKFRPANPTIRLVSLEVFLAEMDGQVMGSAIIEP